MQLFQQLLEPLQFRCHNLFGRGKGIPHCVGYNGGLIQNNLIILERGKKLQRKSKSGHISFVQSHEHLETQKKYAFFLSQ